MATTNRNTRRVLRRFVLVSSPLARPSDRLQALARVIVLLVLLAAVPVAAAVATVTYSDGTAAAAAEAASRSQVQARLLADAAARDTLTGPTSGAEVAPVRWNGRDGRQHEDVVPVRPGARAGSSVTIWIDRSGHHTAPPTTSGTVAARAFGFAVLTFLGIASVAGVAYAALRATLDRARMRRWAADWAAVEPVWTHTPPDCRD